jgi:uncharacterized protein (DUF697 family)
MERGGDGAGPAVAADVAATYTMSLRWNACGYAKGSKGETGAC